MKAVHIIFKGTLGQQEVRVQDDAVVTVLQVGQWATLCFRHGLSLYPHVQFFATLDTWKVKPC